MPENAWELLPGRIRDPLLLSGSGDVHLFEQFNALTAEMAKPGSPHPPGLRELWQDMALHLWELSPLSDEVAAIVLLLHGQRPFLPPALVPLCKICRALPTSKDNISEKLSQLIFNGDLDAAKAFLERKARGQDSPHWLHFAAILGLRMGEMDWYEPWLTSTPAPGPLALVFQADYAFARNDWEKAAALYAQAFAATRMTEWQVREGECHLRAGNREQALVLWTQAYARRPWQINLLLRLSDLQRGHDLPGELPKGQGLILLYSWNHGPALDLTLQALAASELGDARILALDNGSSDDTPGILAAWKQRLEGRLDSIRLPTNVGAPAARNWLLCTDSVKNADWVIFLDDDALVPPNWLRYFGAALAASPEAAIVGCRIVDQAAPMTLQSIDLHFKAAVDNNGEFTAEAPFKFMAPHLMMPDFGQYSYMRPATSVTGCCHLLTRQSLDGTGLFDLRYSPSQFDDFERDLRSALEKRLCVYQGHLRVAHIKRSGSVINMSNWQIANAEGNMRKLSLSYPPAKVAEISRLDLISLRADLEKRMAKLRLCKAFEPA